MRIFPFLICRDCSSLSVCSVPYYFFSRHTSGNEFLLPRLKQLPLNSVNAERVRQELLAQHKELIAKIVALLRDSGNDVRTLAKLWQLESKMASVSTTGSYDARIERIKKAKDNLSSRIRGNVELLYGFSKVPQSVTELSEPLNTPGQIKSTHVIFQYSEAT